MGLFDKKKQVPTKEFWKTVEKDTGRIPHTGWRKLNWRERRKLIRGTFPRAGSQGSIVQSWEFKRALRKINEQRTALKREAGLLRKKGDVKGAASREKQIRDLRGKIQYLGKLGGGRWGSREVRRKNW